MAIHEEDGLAAIHYEYRTIHRSANATLQTLGILVELQEK